MSQSESLFEVAKDNHEPRTVACFAAIVAIFLLSVPDEVGQTPLHYAAVFGNELFLRLAFEKLGGSVGWFNKRDNSNRVPLHLAVWNGHTKCVQFLLEIGVERDAQEKGGYTPLYFAVYRQNPDMVRLLLLMGCSCAVTSFLVESLLTPLNQACILGRIEVVRVLLGQKAKEGGVDPKLREAMLQHARAPTDFRGAGSVGDGELPIGFPNRETFKRDREQLFINTRDANGNTPLINAIRNRKVKVVVLLLASGADPAIPDKHLNTPLHLAANAGLLDYVKLLISRLTPEQRLKVNGKNCTVLDIAQTNDNQELVAYLLANGFPERSEKDGTGEDEEGTVCTICTDLLHLPCELPCGHVFCLYCATKSLRLEAGNLCPYRCEKRLAPGAVLTTSPKRDQELREKHTMLCQKREAVFLKQRANANLRALAAHLGKRPDELRFNESNTCDATVPADPDAAKGLAAAATEPLVVKVALLGKELYAYHTLLKQLPECPTKRLAVLGLMAEGNCLGSLVCSGSISILNNGEVVVSLAAQLVLAKDTALREIVTVLSRCAPGWRARIESVLSSAIPMPDGGDAVAAAAVTASTVANLMDSAKQQCPLISESPAPFLLSERVGTLDKAKLVVGYFQEQLRLQQQQQQQTGSDQQQQGGPTLTFDGTKTWLLKNAKLSLSVTYEERSDSLYVYSPVWNGLPKRPEVRSRLFEQLLRLNLFFTELPNGGVGVDVHGDFVLVHCILQLGSVPPTALGDCAQTFMTQVDRCIQTANQNVNQFATLMRAAPNKADHGRIQRALEAAKDCSRRALPAWLWFCPHLVASEGCLLLLEESLAPLHSSVLALKVALVVSTGTGHSGAAAAIAHSTLNRLGFAVITLVGPSEATLGNVMHTLNYVHALALGKRVCTFHFHFSGPGARALDDGHLAEVLLLPSGGEPQHSSSLPVSLLRHYAELLACHDVLSTQIVLDTDYRRYPWTDTNHGASPVQNGSDHGGPLRELGDRLFLRSFAWSRTYPPRGHPNTWADLRPNIWAVQACHDDESCDHLTNRAAVGRLTQCLYYVLQTPAKEDKHRPEAALAWSKGLQLEDVQPGAHFAHAPELHRRGRNGRQEPILQSHAFKSSVEHVFHLTHVLMYRIHLTACAAGAPSTDAPTTAISATEHSTESPDDHPEVEEQNPVLFASHTTRAMKPFADERPIADEVVDDTFLTAPVPEQQQQQQHQTVTLMAGQLHGVYEGQEFVLLGSDRRPFCRGIVRCVLSASSRLELVQDPHGAVVPALEAGKQYQAQDAWHASGSFAPADQDPRITVNLTSSFPEDLESHAPVFANRKWLDAVIQAKTAAPYESCDLWIVVHHRDEEPALPSEEGEYSEEEETAERLAAPALHTNESGFRELVGPTLTPEQQQLVNQILDRRRAHTRDTQQNSQQPQEVVTTDLQQDGEIGFPAIRALSQLLPQYAPLQQTTDQLRAAFGGITTDLTTAGFLDFFTGMVWHDPVAVSDGFTYEREPFTLWARYFRTSPARGVPLLSVHPYPAFFTLQQQRVILASHRIAAPVPLQIQPLVELEALPSPTTSEAEPHAQSAEGNQHTNAAQLPAYLHADPPAACASTPPPQPTKGGGGDTHHKLAQTLLELEDLHQISASAALKGRLRAVFAQECRQALRRTPAEPKPEPEDIGQLPLWQEKWLGPQYAYPTLLAGLAVDGAEPKWVGRWVEQCLAVKRWREKIALDPRARATATALLLAELDDVITDKEERAVLRASATKTKARRHQKQQQQKPESGATSALAFYLERLQSLETPLEQILESFRNTLTEKRSGPTRRAATALADTLLKKKTQTLTHSRSHRATPLLLAPTSSREVSSATAALEAANQQKDPHRRLEEYGLTALRLQNLSATETCGPLPAGLQGNTDPKATPLPSKRCPARGHAVGDAKATLFIRRSSLLLSSNADRKSPAKLRLMQPQFGATDVDKVQRVTRKLGRSLRKLRVQHPAPGNCSRLASVRVEVQHQRGDQITKYELNPYKPRKFLPFDVHPGDIVRLNPFLSVDPTSTQSGRYFLYLYDFLPSGGVAMLDRAPIQLQPRDKNKFPGTGGVIEWEEDYLLWEEEGQEEGGEKAPTVVAFEHFKLFLCAHDVNPIQLMKHVFEENPRSPSEEVEWLTFTTSFRITNPLRHCS